MTNYSKTQNYTPKDALATGDPEKLILGSDFDAELDLIVTAIGTKYQSSDLSTQAQAIAGTNNTTLMTPLRVAEAIGGNGGGSGAGMVLDILLLADPNADRGLFWDDSAGAVALFAVGTGLEFSTTNLNLVLGSIDHDSLLNWSANKHIDHSAVSITTAAASGLQGGGTIAATRTLTLDINGLTTDNSPDTSVDYVPYYDAGEGTHNKILMSSLVGASVGDGRFYLSGAQALAAATEATIVYNATDYNSLTRGTFSTSTGIYTAGADGCRVLVTVCATVTSLNPGQTFQLSIYQDAVEKARGVMRNDADSTAGEAYLCVSVTLTIGGAATARIKAETSSASSLTTALAYNSVSFVELA